MRYSPRVVARIRNGPDDGAISWLDWSCKEKQPLANPYRLEGTSAWADAAVMARAIKAMPRVRMIVSFRMSPPSRDRARHLTTGASGSDFLRHACGVESAHWRSSVFPRRFVPLAGPSPLPGTAP